MQNKLYVLVLSFIFALFYPLLAQSGQMTLVTYYPAPSGNYNKLTSNSVGIGTASPGSPLSVNGGASFGSFATSAAPAGGIIASGNVGLGTVNPQSPAPNGQSGNLDANDVYDRTAGKWLSTTAVPTGTVLIWAGTTLPAGYLWCNGQIVTKAAYPALFAALHTTYGGDGVTTFGLPNLMARTAVGIDGMGGAPATNLITSWGAAPAALGGTFGEGEHRQTVTELAPHVHEEQGYGYSGGSFHPLRFSDSNQTGASDGYVTTMSTGGNGDGSGLGAPANVVQPSIALAYIIKT